MPLLTKAYLGSTKLWEDKAWFQDSFSSLDDSGDVTVTADTAAHTKGAWSELIASTSANATFLQIQVNGIHVSGTNTATLLDIGFGAATSEVVKIANIAVGGAQVTATLTQGIWIDIPFQIPSGTRIAARIQSVVTGGKTATVLARTYDTGDYSSMPTSVDVIGTDTATSEGVGFVSESGGGTYKEVIASTSQSYRALVLVPNVSGTATANHFIYYTVARGAAGSEVVLRDDLQAWTTSAESINTTAPNSFLFGANVPSGSRLAVKPTSSGFLNSNYGCCLIGIP